MILAFEGMILRGRVRATFLGGQPVFLRDEAGVETFAPRPWRDVLAVV